MRSNLGFSGGVRYRARCGRRLALALALACGWGVSLCAGAAQSPRNIVIFVADGLRPGSVNEQDAPTMSALRREGVRFDNSHALFPTVTTANASAIATGHLLGDTGNFSNGLYPGFPIFDAGNFGKRPGTLTPFIESDTVLADLDDHFEGNYLGEEGLLAVARAHGYSTAAIGKVGPAAIQDVTQVAPRDGKFDTPATIIIDDSTGTAEGVPLEAQVAAALQKAGLPPATPVRVQPQGDSHIAGSRSPNWGQQVYFAEAATRVVLPLLKARGKPFVMIYWSRDPDGTQHNQGDSLNALVPGINGPTSRAAVRNADENLRQILEFIRADATLAATTDVLVTADHGFATISKHDIDSHHHGTASFAASGSYDDVPAGFVPPGFLAIDLAEHLDEPLFDPDSPVKNARGEPVYQRIRPKGELGKLERRHPLLGNGLLGGSGRVLADSDADIIVTANGGSDLLYLPHGDAQRLRAIVDFLAAQDYTGAIFVDDAYGAVPGALPMSTAGLEGVAKLPKPAIILSFRTFVLGMNEAASSDPLQNAVQIADTALQQGQGMHGSFSRDNTFNFMAAIGPDFKQGFRDGSAVSNADLAPTIARLLDVPLSGRGALGGRVLEEALRGGPGGKPGQRCLRLSPAARDGRRTVLEYQQVDHWLYFDQATFRIIGTNDTSGCK
jgi:hypothetical protein